MARESDVVSTNSVFAVTRPLIRATLFGALGCVFVSLAGATVYLNDPESKPAFWITLLCGFGSIFASGMLTMLGLIRYRLRNS